MIAIDTNLIVRYLTGDHPAQSSRAREIVDGQAVFITVTVILEVEWVLRSAYNYARSDVVRALRAFCGLPTVTIEEATIVAASFGLTERGIDFADALHLTKAAHCEEFITFDRKFIKATQAAGYETVREA